ncbi:IPT/TIG domain-containing protein [Algoriphagus sp. CAU 1675]|uniref:IPT/TIG domain-containing protein n=1 Tax=Algoriphagus sp. CAU 1675 TaxID=3032597 RepID=UPI0023DC62CB|nr:IPT/TIG domain-containing protein [Algoriphagus sp. CAU 1675]MDF2158819.1 IPT/TIG domain-containing protein [Algoriphagus sp. CAU 1675]
MRNLLSIGIIAMLLLGWGCTEEEDGLTSVATEEALFVSGEKIRLLGRLISNQAMNADDHGFYLSSSESFTSPIKVSLGVKDGPGRFIGEADGLEIGELYFVKAFASIGGQEIMGEVLEIQTLLPAIIDFSPSFAKAGDEIIITGKVLPEDTRVFFGDQEATVLENTFEAKIRVRVPPSTTEKNVPIRVQVRDLTLEFEDNFEYQSGKYFLVSEVPGGVRVYDNIFFQNSEGLYFGLGRQKNSELYPYIQRYSLQSETWEQLSFPGTLREKAFATEHFLGGGTIQLGRDEFLDDRTFWKINGSNFEKLPNLPFSSNASVAFELKGNLYLLGGEAEMARRVARYNPITLSWDMLMDAPFEISNERPFFIYRDHVYMIDPEGVLWEIDPDSNSWQEKSFYPGNTGSANGYGMALVLGDKAYVGLYRRSQDMWELDMNTLSWKPKNSMGGLPQSVTVGHYVRDGKIYILREPEVQIPGVINIEMYRFDPDGI